MMTQKKYGRLLRSHKKEKKKEKKERKALGWYQGTLLGYLGEYFL